MWNSRLSQELSHLILCKYTSRVLCACDISVSHGHTSKSVNDLFSFKRTGIFNSVQCLGSDSQVVYPMTNLILCPVALIISLGIRTPYYQWLLAAIRRVKGFQTLSQVHYISSLAGGSTSRLRACDNLRWSGREGRQGPHCANSSPSPTTTALRLVPPNSSATENSVRKV
jgi:hypothetical protein